MMVTSQGGNARYAYASLWESQRHGNSDFSILRLGLALKWQQILGLGKDLQLKNKNKSVNC